MRKLDTILPIISLLLMVSTFIPLYAQTIISIDTTWSGTVNVTSDVQDTVLPGTGNISSDPNFTDEKNIFLSRQ